MTWPSILLLYLQTGKTSIITDAHIPLSVPPHLAVVIHSGTQFQPVSASEPLQQLTQDTALGYLKIYSLGHFFCCCPPGHPVCISTTNHTVRLAYCILNSQAVGKENSGTTSSLLLRHFWCRLLSGNTTRTKHWARWHTLPIFSYHSAILSVLNLKGEERILCSLFKLKRKHTKSWISL